MKYILLFVALNQQPAELGSYNSVNSCKDAIRTIYATRMIVPALQYSQQQLTVINRAIDTQLQYQQEYRCVAKQQQNKMVAHNSPFCYTIGVVQLI